MKNKPNTCNIKYEFDPGRRPMFKASQNRDIRFICDYSESSEGDRVTNKFSSTIWYCPIKYNQLHIKSLCLPRKHSDLVTELLRAQRGLNSQGEKKAGAVSNPETSDSASHANTSYTMLDGSQWSEHCEISILSSLILLFFCLSLLHETLSGIIHCLVSLSFNTAHEEVAFN